MTITSPRIRVLVVDDHPMVRRKLDDLVTCYPDMQVVGVAEDGPGALDAAKNLLPDVVLLDVSLPGLSGIEVARKLRHSIPPARIIMLVEFVVEPVVKIMDGNGYSYALKSNPTSMAQAIRTVHRGERWLAQ